MFDQLGFDAHLRHGINMVGRLASVKSGGAALKDIVDRAVAVPLADVVQATGVRCFLMISNGARATSPARYGAMARADADVSHPEPGARRRRSRVRRSFRAVLRWTGQAPAVSR
ncbi:hypothetical protein [Streptomyces sp. NPDC093984]|uniref:hypothetical protein n=1 Tax=Streptomyces sp. NPDC093984 TaxID=3366052 RepID=UPI0037F6EB5F